MAKCNPASIRTDEWPLLATADVGRMATDTVTAYRKMANALATVFLTHWPQVHDLPVQDLESFFHDTKKTQGTKYGVWFRRRFGKFPAYLRRAATMAAHGSVSSYMTCQQAWQGGNRRMREQRPPVWGGVHSWPTLYAANGGAGAMIRRQDGAVSLKLLDSASGDWLWRTVVVARKGKRDGKDGLVPKSPSLVVRGGSLALSQPYEFAPARRKPWLDRRGKAPLRVCGVDQGINKQATLSIVDEDGTVIARKFVSLAAHIDRRDKVLREISAKAALTMGKGGKLFRGFCRTLYARARGLNTHVAREVSRAAHAFAGEHGAQVLVFEDLRGWRPRGGAKRSGLRQKFHGWLHRAVVEQAERTGEERGVAVELVHPRGTSSWAYDGSGRVVRDRFDFGRCRFRSGKEYDCDLSASYNIAARWFARRGLLASQRRPDADRREAGRQRSPAGWKPGWPVRGRRTAAGPGTPVTLSSMWASRTQRAAA